MKVSKLLMGFAPIGMLGIIFLAVLSAGGGEAGSVAAYPILASQEKAEEYANYASQMGAPWDIVMLADAINSYQDEESNIEHINPLVSTLQFLYLDETVEHYEVVETIVDPETGEITYIYDWVVTATIRYTAREEILSYAELQQYELELMNPTELVDKVNIKAANKTNDNWRYSVSFSVNGAFETVLRKYFGMDDETVKQVMDLYKSDYLFQMNLSEDAQARIKNIQAEYGMYQYVDGDYSSSAGLTFTDGGVEVKYYNQLDSRWADLPYGKRSTIGRAGCGPTAMSIVISTFTGTDYDPVYMCAWSESNGYLCDGSGSYRTLIPGAAQSFGLTVESCGTGEGQRIVNALSEGKLVVAIMGKGHFTNYGHYIVLRGVIDGKILVADPASRSRSETKWDLSLILNEVSKTIGNTGPLWIIGRNH